MFKTFATLLLWLIACHLSAQYGILDPAFGDGGLVRTRYEPGYAAGYDMVLQPDGKILVAGQISDSTSHLAVFRYLPNGDLDATFGDNGIAILPQSANGSFGYRLKLQPDGKIVVAGQANLDGYWDVAVARFLPNGKPDLAFGNGGIATLDVWGLHDQVLGMALQPDGKVIVVGMTTKTNPDFSLGLFTARFRPDGDLDNTFADNGVFMRDNPSFFDVATCANVLSDGKILIGGYHWPTTTSGTDYMLQRLLPDGSPDPAFGDNGMLIYDFTDAENIYSMVVQPDEKILVGSDSDSKLGLLRLNADGSLDAGFGDEGRVVIGFGDFHCDGSAVALQPDGSPDATFGDEGRVKTTFGNEYYDWGYALAIQPDHKIIMAGYSTNGPDTHVSLARYLSNYEPPPGDTSALEEFMRLYPNPTEGDATLEFWLGQETTVALDLYDAQGRLMQNLWSPEMHAAGIYVKPLSLSDFVAAGMYFLTFNAGDQRQYLPVVKQ